MMARAYLRAQDGHCESNVAVPGAATDRREHAGRRIAVNIRPFVWAFATLLCVTRAAIARPEATPQVEVRISDVELFYRIYDAAKGAPTAEVLQREYLDGGSDGVRQFIPNRIRSADALAKTIAEHRDVYDKARGCAVVLPAVRIRLAAVFAKLSDIDPSARFPRVIVLIGRNNSGGTTGDSGVLIGLEVACRADWLQSDLMDRLVHLIAHEYGHVQQFPQGGEDLVQRTVLVQSLVEGEAELIAELTSGEASESHIQRWTVGHEREIGEAFLADLDSMDYKPWLYNGVGTPEKPGDLGYWLGYCIAKEYYRRAHNKRAALRTLLELKDPKQILADSGWRPGDRAGR
jgi:Predicted Zn-dependent protease (DUF2268)